MTDGARNFHTYLSSNNILCHVKNNNGNEVLKMLLDALKRHFPELDIDTATNEVLAREEIFSTVIAPGLALPHARLAGLNEPLVAMACCPDGADFTDGATVNVMILLLTPVDEPNLHMSLMAALAVDFSKPDAIKKVASLMTPYDVIGYFSGNEVVMSEYLTAKDVMEHDVPTILETDNLNTAINIFATHQAEEMPVLDSTGDLRGIISLYDILKHSLPEHLLWMENLAPIYRFQPFADMLKTSSDTKIADIMREEFTRVDEDVPAIQLAKLFIVSKEKRLVIVDKKGHLTGIVELKAFCDKVFWE